MLLPGCSTQETAPVLVATYPVLVATYHRTNSNSCLRYILLWYANYFVMKPEVLLYVLWCFTLFLGCVVVWWQVGSQMKTFSCACVCMSLCVCVFLVFVCSCVRVLMCECTAVCVFVFLCVSLLFWAPSCLRTAFTFLVTIEFWAYDNPYSSDPCVCVSKSVCLCAAAPWI